MILNYGKKASQFIFRKDYEKWLLKQGVNSVGAYCPQDKYKCNGKDYLYLDLIGVFAIEDERLYVNALLKSGKLRLIRKTILRLLLTACLIFRNIDSSLKPLSMVKKIKQRR